MGDYKKQHYVPKSYLREWSSDGRRIWLFDKQTGESRNVGIRSVAQATYFNDAFRRIRGQVTDGEPPDLMERQFQTWENDFLMMRQVALDVAANRRGGSLAERRTMSVCAAIQLLRTAKARSLLLQEAAEYQSGQSNGLIDWLDEPLRQRMVHVPGFAQEHISMIQACLLWNTNIIPHIATELYHYLWVIAKNLTQFPFYTSDAPVAALTHGAEQPPYYPTPRLHSGPSKGWPLVKQLFCEKPLERGLELIFPVSPKCAMLMFHPFDFEKEFGDKQGKVLVVGEQSVQICNIAIAGAAVRQVLSLTDDFQMADLAVRYAKRKRDKLSNGYAE